LVSSSFADFVLLFHRAVSVLLPDRRSSRNTFGFKLVPGFVIIAVSKVLLPDDRSSRNTFGFKLVPGFDSYCYIALFQKYCYQIDRSSRNTLVSSSFADLIHYYYIRSLKSIATRSIDPVGILFGFKLVSSFPDLIHYSCRFKSIATRSIDPVGILWFQLVRDLILLLLAFPKVLLPIDPVVNFGFKLVPGFDSYCYYCAVSQKYTRSIDPVGNTGFKLVRRI
jgi:hypothetical protein